MLVKVDVFDYFVINVCDVVVIVEWYCRIFGMDVKVFDFGGGKVLWILLYFGN